MHEGFGGLTRVITELNTLLASRGTTVTEIVGRAADALQGYDEQAIRPERWRAFVPAETLT
jgi:hypothetical protein